MLISMTCLFYGGVPIGTWALRMGQSTFWLLWLVYSMEESLGTWWFLWLLYFMVESLGTWRVYSIWWSPNRDLTSESGKVTLLLVSMTCLSYGGVPRDLVVSMTVLFYGGVLIGTWPLRVGRSPWWFLWLVYSIGGVPIGTWPLRVGRSPWWFLWLVYSMMEYL